MRINTKERNKIETINNNILRPDAKGGKFMVSASDNRTINADVTKERAHRMEGVGRVYESLIDQMVANSMEESNIDPAIMRQYSTVASKAGQKSENDQLLADIKQKQNLTSAEQREEWKTKEMILSKQYSIQTGVPLDMGDTSKKSKK